MGETEQMAAMYDNFPRSRPVYPAIPGQPRRKILLFSQLQITFDYETKVLNVARANDLSNEFSFDDKDLLELKAALRSFGMEVETR